MKPGQELDELIAQRVMGWTRTKKEDPPRWGFDGPAGYWFESFGIPRFSTHLESAWLVVNKVTSEGKRFVLQFDGDEWWATIGDNEAYAETAPYAIALAACDL